MIIIIFPQPTQANPPWPHLSLVWWACHSPCNKCDNYRFPNCNTHPWTPPQIWRPRLALFRWLCMSVDEIQTAIQSRQTQQAASKLNFRFINPIKSIYFSEFPATSGCSKWDKSVWSSWGYICIYAGAWWWPQNHHHCGYMDIPNVTRAYP